MRAFRSVAGLVLAVLSGLLLAGVAAAAVVGRHEDADGGFSADLAPIRGDGYAIVVADLASTIGRHGVAGMLGRAGLLDDARLTIAARSAEPVRLALAPSDQVARYLDGVARTEVTAVGFAAGPQPVSVGTVSGPAVPANLPRDPAWLVGEPGGPLSWTISSARMSLVILPVDREAGLEATLTATVTPAAWGVTVAAPLAGAAVVLLIGAVLLAWPGGRREVVLVVEPGQVAAVADRVARHMGTGWIPGRRRAGRAVDVLPSSYQDTGYGDDWLDPGSDREYGSYADTRSSYVNSAT